MKPRASGLGLEIGRLPRGAENAITDVAGVRVGHTTLVEGNDVRTGVTVVLPPPEPLFAGCHRINGNGELTGLEWIRDSGLLTSAVALTNTHSVGVVRDALISESPPGEGAWSLPVVGETWDGFLNDINGFHVRPAHVRSAIQSAVAGPVAEGAVGGGTGMICHGFKGGIGTASRVVAGNWTVGALVQANHGARRRLRVNGAPRRKDRGGSGAAARAARGRGIDHRPTRDRRPSPSGSVRAPRSPHGVRDRAHGWARRALERRLCTLLRDRKS